MTAADDAKAAAAQGDLFDGDDQVGRMRRTPMADAIKAAVESAQLDDRDKGMAQLAIECGYAVDVAQRRRDPYAVAAAARELRETLIRLQLDPTSRGEGNRGDSFDEWLRGIGTAEVGDAAKP